MAEKKFRNVSPATITVALNAVQRNINAINIGEITLRELDSMKGPIALTDPVNYRKYGNLTIIQALENLAGVSATAEAREKYYPVFLKHDRQDWNNPALVEMFPHGNIVKLARDGGYPLATAITNHFIPMDTSEPYAWFLEMLSAAITAEINHAWMSYNTSPEAKKMVSAARDAIHTARDKWHVAIKANVHGLLDMAIVDQCARETAKLERALRRLIKSLDLEAIRCDLLP